MLSNWRKEVVLYSRISTEPTTYFSPYSATTCWKIRTTDFPQYQSTYLRNEVCFGIETNVKRYAIYGITWQIKANSDKRMTMTRYFNGRLKLFITFTATDTRAKRQNWANIIQPVSQYHVAGIISLACLCWILVLTSKPLWVWRWHNETVLRSFEPTGQRLQMTLALQQLCRRFVQVNACQKLSEIETLSRCLRSVYVLQYRRWWQTLGNKKLTVLYWRNIQNSVGRTYGKSQRIVDGT